MSKNEKKLNKSISTMMRRKDLDVSAWQWAEMGGDLCEIYEKL